MGGVPGKEPKWEGRRGGGTRGEAESHRVCVHLRLAKPFRPDCSPQPPYPVRGDRTLRVPKEETLRDSEVLCSRSRTR